jgi:hypothetical protein
LIGCGGGGTIASVQVLREEGAMAEVPSRRLAGDWFDVCRCRVPCACTFAQAPDDGTCGRSSEHFPFDGSGPGGA